MNFILKYYWSRNSAGFALLTHSLYIPFKSSWLWSYYSGLVCKNNQKLRIYKEHALTRMHTCTNVQIIVISLQAIRWKETFSLALEVKVNNLPSAQGMSPEDDRAVSTPCFHPIVKAENICCKAFFTRATRRVCVTLEKSRGKLEGNILNT